MEMPISVGGKFLKGADFDAGKTLTITGKPELVVCSNPKYGFPDGPNQGKTVRYYFKDQSGDRIFDSKASRFATAISRFEVGDTIHIQRNAAGTDTTYSANKVEKGETPLDQIPF
jgi:hypothetical protein